jgi:hypothetical protein
VEEYLISFNDYELDSHKKSLSKTPPIPIPQRKKEKNKPAINNTINDVFYYKELFKNSKDKMKYFEYIKKQYLDQGYPECEALNQLCYLNVLVRDKNIALAKSQSTEGLISTDKDDIREISTLLESADKILEQLKDTFDKNKKEKTISGEIQNILAEAEDYVRKNIGEHQFKCSGCGVMVDTYGLPHWAYETTSGPDGKTIYMLWNQQMWESIKGIEISDKYGKKRLFTIEPFWACFFMETSIEGLIFTAHQRGMKVERKEENGRRIALIDGVSIDVEDQEEKFKVLYDYFKLIYHKRSYRDL